MLIFFRRRDRLEVTVLDFGSRIPDFVFVVAMTRTSVSRMGWAKTVGQELEAFLDSRAISFESTRENHCSVATSDVAHFTEFLGMMD